MRNRRIAAALLGLFAAAVLPTSAQAVSGYYSSDCAGCHGSSPTTCTGCHQHGSSNLAGSISKTSFAPGESMSITVTSGSRGGWWRAAVLDASNNVVSQVPVASGTTATLSVPAPSSSGSYSWKVAWYGNQRSANPPSGASWVPDGGNSNHGYLTRALTAFTVAATPVPAPKAALSAASLAFGNVTVGQSATRTANVTNTGNAALSVTRITPCANTVPPFAISPSAAFSVAAGGSQTLTVTFAPTSSGAVTGCFDIATNDPAAATLRLAVTGTGASVPTPSAALAPASVAFGTVNVGQTPSLTATLRNTGGAALSVTGVTPCDSSNAASLTVSPTAASSVAAGGSQVFTVRFAPTAAGAAAACWNVATNDPANATLQLRATGTGAAVAPSAPIASLTPASVAFGNVTVGQTPSLTATVRNTGTASLSVTGVTPCDASNAATLTVSPTAAFAVAAGGSQVLTVRFAPAAAGAAAACWNVATNDPAHATLQLRATGTGVAVAPPPPTGSCTSCHAIPPATGRHALHKSEGVGCRSCHGSGYSTSTVNAATHQNGKVNLSSRTGWRVSSRSCANSCHDSEKWSTTRDGHHDDGDDHEDDDFQITPEDEEVTGGCSNVGGSLSLAGLLGIGALGLLRRRRRA